MITQEKAKHCLFIFNDNIQQYVNNKLSNNNNQLPPDLARLPIGLWDVSNVTNMQKLFKNKTIFNEDISNWNVSNVQSMNSIFCKCNIKECYKPKF